MFCGGMARFLRKERAAWRRVESVEMRRRGTRGRWTEWDLTRA